MASQFKSKLADSFSSYIELKHALGYKFVTGEKLLIRLDSFIKEHFPSSDTLTEDIVQAWGFAWTSSVSPQTQNKRLALLTDLGIFLKLENENTFVLDRQKRFAADKSFTCKILTEDEVIKIFTEADNYRDKTLYGGVTLSVVLRLMYITGIRPGEALKLKLNNFISERYEIDIEESKSFKSRRIVISEELCQLINKYLFVTGASRHSDEMFLFTISGDRSEQVPSRWLYDRLHTLCKRASVVFQKF